MVRLARSAYLGVAWLFVILIPVQFLLAGAGAFSATFSATMYTPHMYLGLFLHGLTVALIAFALIGSMPRRALSFGVLQFILLTIQVLLVQLYTPGTALAIEPPFVSQMFVATMQPIHNALAGNSGLVASLHAVNGLAIAGVAVLNLLYARRLAQPSPPPAVRLAQPL